MTRTSLVSVVVAFAVALLAACNDEDLNQFGATGAYETTVEVTAHDGWFEIDDGGAGIPAQVQIHPHNDVTFRVTNAGTEVHSFALYADPDGRDLLVRTEEIPPGASVVTTYHFHDPQTAYFRDDSHPDEMRGEVHVAE